MKEKIVGDLLSLQYEYYSWLKEFAEIVQISLQKDAWLSKQVAFAFVREKIE